MTRAILGLFGWLNLLVAGAGVVVSALGVGRSRWALLLLGGFSGEAAVSLLYRLREFLGLAGAAASWESIYIVTSAVGLAARSAVVIGVAGLLWEQRPRPPAAG